MKRKLLADSSAVVRKQDKNKTENKEIQKVRIFTISAELDIKFCQEKLFPTLRSTGKWSHSNKVVPHTIRLLNC